MEQPKQYHNGEEPSYWTSVALVGLIFGAIVTALNILGGYMFIGSEPGGSMINSQMVMIGVGCLIAAFGGMVTIWHYNREFGVRMKLGRGALIGLFTGIAVAFFSTLLSQVWYLIDPTYLEQVMEQTIAAYETSEMFDDETRQLMIDSTYTEYQNMQTAWGIIKNFLIGGAIIGILNMLTGMLGVAMFAREHNEI